MLVQQRPPHMRLFKEPNEELYRDGSQRDTRVGDVFKAQLFLPWRQNQPFMQIYADWLNESDLDEKRLWESWMSTAGPEHAGSLQLGFTTFYYILNTISQRTTSLIAEIHISRSNKHEYLCITNNKTFCCLMSCLRCDGCVCEHVKHAGCSRTSWLQISILSGLYSFISGDVWDTH